MPDADPAHYRLNDLKLRWQRDPSSRLFLQLADEHRKLGQREEAVTVLEQGLEHRPNDLSALVALGRCRLELEQVEGAIEPLETVVSRDPTHIVASKLLLEAHLQRGDAAKAGQRLDTYRLLNDRDPELDHLEYRLERLRSESEEAPTAVGALDEVVVEEPEEVVVEEPVEAVAEEPEEAAEEPVETVVEDPVKVIAEEPEEVIAEEPVEAVAEEPEEAVAGEPAEAASAVEEEAEAEAVAAVPAAAPDLGSEPFAFSGDRPPAPDFTPLWEQLPQQKSAFAEPFVGLTALDTEQHWQLLSREGVFGAAGAPAGNGDAATEPAALMAPEVAVEPAAAVEPVAAEPEVAFEAEAAIEDEPVAAEPEATAGPAMAAVAGVAAAVAVAAAAAAREPEAVETAPDLEAAEVAPVAGELAAAEPAAVESAEPAAVQVEEAAPFEEPPAPEVETAVGEPDEEPATATLGELYLKQGHLEEAERIFRQVLEQEPGNRSALEGLEQLGKRRSKSLSAADLLAVKSASGRIPEGLTAKKVLVLGNYVRHLKAATQSHVS